ncbi:MAG: PEP/pyruvate-binding domain-containing protein [Candidatus Hodarchaeales archaeon]|jgi:pyruvate,water dikinase
MKKPKNNSECGVVAFKNLKSEKDISLAGGKGVALAQMYQAGYPVPNGFVILSSAFSNDELRSESWEQIQLLLEQFRKSDKRVSFAIRSSALAEDSATAAFAGQFETILDVSSNSQILEAIHTVYQSKNSERVESYSKIKGIEIRHDIGIVVEKLIHSEISGVLFTADPITGNINSMSGSYVFGMGEQLVSGETDASDFQFTRPKGIYTGPLEFKKYAKQLFSLAKRVEEKFGCPQDIEWAVFADKVFLLQSRPITTLIGYDPITGYENESLRGDYFWAFTGIGELLPNILKPSDWSIWVIYNSECSEHDWFLPHKLYANIGGRVYTNASVMVSSMKKMRYNDQRIKEIFEESLGELPSELVIPSFHVSYRTLLFKTIPDEIRWQRKVKRLKKNIPSFLESFKSHCKGLEVKIKHTTDKVVLADLLLDEIKPAYLDAIWYMKVANEVFYMPLNNLSIELGKKIGKSDSNTLIQGRPSESAQLESLGPLIGLQDILAGEMTREEYMDRYGHRDPFENYLSYSRPLEEPTWLDDQLKSVTPMDFDKIIQERISEFDASVERLTLAVKPKKAKKYLKKIEILLDEMHTREELRSELTRSIWLIRLFFLRAGELLNLKEDIFYLSMEEVLDLLAGRTTNFLDFIPTRKDFFTKLEALPPYPGTINGRFDPFEWSNDPNHRKDLFDSHITLTKEVIEDPNTIKGLPGSTGKVEAVVRIISDPDEGDQLLPGEVLVTRTTNVGWTPLFGRAAAIVTDIGSPLAHAAIVARELRIPAVVGCSDATLRLKTGDKVIVDGGLGIVTITN